MKEQIIRILENRARKFESINHSFEAREVKSAIDTIRRLVPPELFAIHIVSNCGDYAKNRPDGIKTDEWWCPNCNEVVPSFDVTNDERHGIEGCMTKVC